MRHTPNALMIFAAGLGTRMRPLTDTMPKPMIPVAGKALIEHVLSDARAAGLGPIVANVHYKPDALIALLEQHGAEVSDERGLLLETGGGLKKALNLLGDDTVFTANSDAVFAGLNPFEHLRKYWDADRMGALLLLIPPKQARGTTNDGDFLRAPDGRLTRGPGAIYTGIQIISTDAVRSTDKDAFSLNEVWNTLADQGRLYGCIYDGLWCDVGQPESIAIAEDLLRNP